MASEPPRRVIVDCDPGHDDALALLFAHGNPDVELAAITTVAGNQTLDKTTRNARLICSVAGITGVPIAEGADRPLLRELVTAGHVHGESGLDGPELGEPTVPLHDGHAVDLLVELVMGAPGELTLVPIGPLTNIALAVRREPRIVDRVREVVLMGGSTERGNQTPAAEFNIFVDPEAAAIVFEAGWPLTMLGLNLTHQAQATPAVVDRIASTGTPAARLAADLLRYYGQNYPRPGFAGPPVHDPCTIARLVRPEAVQCVEAHVAVETRGSLTAGMTVTDFRPRVPCNAQVGMHLDAPAFWDLLIAALGRVG
ncbi:MAG TPA: nucleoside hydrolase [Candidatus Binatia bacterium]|nr:nucleoside hydrolase [Candidatus Binatia bacterium]